MASWVFIGRARGAGSAAVGGPGTSRDRFSVPRSGGRSLSEDRRPWRPGAVFSGGRHRKPVARTKSGKKASDVVRFTGGPLWARADRRRLKEKRHPERRTDRARRRRRAEPGERQLQGLRLRAPQCPGPGGRQDAQVPHPRPPRRPGDPRGLAVRPEPRPHHLPPPELTARRPTRRRRLWAVGRCVLLAARLAPPRRRTGRRSRGLVATAWPRRRISPHPGTPAVPRPVAA